MSETEKIKGITVVSPMWGERKITDRMVFSVVHQYLGHKDPLNIELVLVDDYIEGRGENDESAYEYYLSDEFKKLLLDSPFVISNCVLFLSPEKNFRAPLNLFFCSSFKFVTFILSTFL